MIVEDTIADEKREKGMNGKLKCLLHKEARENIDPKKVTSRTVLLGGHCWLCDLTGFTLMRTLTELTPISDLHSLDGQTRYKYF